VINNSRGVGSRSCLCGIDSLVAELSKAKPSVDRQFWREVALIGQLVTDKAAAFISSISSLVENAQREKMEDCISDSVYLAWHLLLTALRGMMRYISREY
jgi:hypothetical protein